MVLIRKAKKEDFEGYFKLESEFSVYSNQVIIPKSFVYSLKKNEVRKLFNKQIKNKDIFFLSVIEDEMVVGFFVGSIDELSVPAYKFKVNKIGFIENVFITKKYRGMGYFSILTKMFFDYLKKRKIKYCVLDVDVQNEMAVNAYKRKGFFIQEYRMFAKVK